MHIEGLVVKKRKEQKKIMKTLKKKKRKWENGEGLGFEPLPTSLMPAFLTIGIWLIDANY
jgi:hypothetical protein